MLLSVNNITKKYKNGTTALKDVSLTAEKGEFISVIGPSGSGKSTLLRTINRMIDIDEGTILFNDVQIEKLKGKEINKFRRQIGMIFQSYNLVERLTVIENVLHGRLGYKSVLAGSLGLYTEEEKQEAFSILEKVDMMKYAYQRCSELSGGQKQRVGIARALMQNPVLLLCDEPIASLDPKSSERVMDYLRKITDKMGITCIVNLHQVDIATKYSDRIIGLNEGHKVFDDAVRNLTKEKVEEIYRRERLPILVGGTGFYIQAMLRDIDFQEEDEAEKERLRSKLEKEMEERGSIALHEELKWVDPVSAEEIHPHNRQRIMRALEYFYLHKSPISKHNREEKEKEALYDSLFLVLNRNREDLYEGINARVEKMFRDGLVSEVEAFSNKGYTEHSPGFKGIGYREIFPYLRGECSLSECKALIQQNSRHYAKRQLTWFKREKNTIFVEAENFKSREEEAEWIIEKCMSKWEFLKRS